MSGFLANLLRRTFDPSVVMVQPRLNPLFAPPERGSEWAAPPAARQGSEPDYTPKNEVDLHAQPFTTQARPASSPRAIIQEKPITAAPSPHPSAISAGTPLVPLAATREPANSSQPAQVGTRATRLEPRNTHRAELKRSVSESLLDPDNTAPKVVNDTGEHMDEIPASKPSTRRRAGPTNSIAHVAADKSPQNDGDTRLKGELALVPGKAPEEHLRKTIHPEGTRRGEQKHTPEVDGKSTAQPVSTPSSLDSSPEMRMVLPPFPPIAAEEHETRTSGALKIAPFPLTSKNLGELRRWASEPIPTPEPTIEVTIGRIEVRGTTPSTAHRAAAQSPAGVNLDDYLRRRSGRSRT